MAKRDNDKSGQAGAFASRASSTSNISPSSAPSASLPSSASSGLTTLIQNKTSNALYWLLKSFPQIGSI
jgi:hypothetical protein